MFSSGVQLLHYCFLVSMKIHHDFVLEFKYRAHFIVGGYASIFLHWSRICWRPKDGDSGYIDTVLYILWSQVWTEITCSIIYEAVISQELNGVVSCIEVFQSVQFGLWKLMFLYQECSVVGVNGIYVFLTNIQGDKC